ncbi:hypothetical protein [Kamptonema formosum]|uniref:hypothetical protein n=1 Tax=Kamptonema formosum TaxID=331992 RepID=UPI000349D4BD|nr:hypothetical protein [Oscillatoria sp. PCC 10802]
MNQNSWKSFQFNFSDAGNWLTALLVIWLLGSIGLGWLVKSILILMGLALIAPALAFFGVRWWLSRNLIEDQCPVCSYEIAALNKTQLQCPSCGEPLQVEQGHLQRLTPPGTIDVKAIEVSAPQLED